jgi:hypothetical protein
MRKYLISALAMSAVLLGACNDSLGPGDVSEADQEDILATLEESGFFSDGFGAEGVSEHVVAYLDGDAAPRVWGRRRGLPVSRVVEVTFDREAGIATVTKTVNFEGEFLVRLDDGSVSSKTLNEQLTQSALLERLAEDRVNDRTGRRSHWRLLEITPKEFRAIDETMRTVNIEQVRIVVNGETVLDLIDPAERLPVERGGVALLSEGDEVSVYADVANTTNLEGNETYVFLHVAHARQDAVGWHRVMMEYSADRGEWVAHWVVRHAGREFVMVDALDSGSFDAAGEYRANIWGLPYRIGETDVATID